MPLAALAYGYAGIRRVAEARKILRDLEQRSASSEISPYIVATIYAGLGERQKAFDYLERAYRERSIELSWSRKADPRLDPLRSDARFQSLLRRVGFPIVT